MVIIVTPIRMFLWMHLFIFSKLILTWYNALQFPMKNTVERSLIDIRTQLRALPANINTAKTAADRQKLLVSTVQEVNQALPL